jgi:hypothetical protein
MESKLKHLEMIQAVINRMAHNSFLLKGWSVTLTAALLALAASNAKPQLILVALFPATMFWGLDGYFLWQERLFRSLYDYVRATDLVDYSMDTRSCLTGTAGWWRTTVSKTLLAFHGVIVLAIVAAAVLAVRGQII